MQPPATGSIEELGYVVQQNFVWPGCSSGATASEHQTEWNYAWGQVDGTYDVLFDPNSRSYYVSAYGDLLGSF